MKRLEVSGVVRPIYGLLGVKRLTSKTGGRDSSVGTATRYGLGSPGIDSRWGRDFPHPFIPVQPLIQLVPGLSRV